MVIMNVLKWPMLSYYVIYYEKFKKVMQWTEKEALKLKIIFASTLNFHYKMSTPGQISFGPFRPYA